MTNAYTFILVLVALCSWALVVIDRYFLVSIRQAKRRMAIGNGIDQAQIEKLLEPGITFDVAKTLAKWMTVIVIVRACLFEPFSVPTSSMLPLIAPGDSIAVNKFAYGIKEPLFGTTLWHRGHPKRGDVVAFANPEAPSVDFVKRVIGMPGDTVIYQDKTVTIHPACDSEPCENTLVLSKKPLKRQVTDTDGAAIALFEETMGSLTYRVAITDSKADAVEEYYRQVNTHTDTFVVPNNHYYVLGDNRDNSRDSRYFGFVHQDFILGKPSTKLWHLEKVNGKWLPSLSLNEMGKNLR